MSPDLDKKLCEAFPLLYRDRHASMMETCMCWGFPGDGWFQLIWDLSAKLEPMIRKWVNENGMENAPHALQVKEKYGLLCFYMSGETAEMSAAIDVAENMSAATCEDCSAPGRTRGTSWLSTQCDACASRAVPL